MADSPFSHLFAPSNQIGPSMVDDLVHRGPVARPEPIPNAPVNAPPPMQPLAATAPPPAAAPAPNAPPLFAAAPAAPAAMPGHAPGMPPAFPQPKMGWTDLAALLPALLGGIKDPVVMGAALAGFHHGQDEKRARMETAQQTQERRMNAQADFYEKALTESQSFDDPIAFQQWKDAIRPMAQLHGVDVDSLPFNKTRQTAKDTKAVSDALDRIVKLHGPEILNRDDVSLQLPDGRTISMKSARAMVGTSVTDARGAAVPVPADVNTSTQRFIAMVPGPNGAPQKVFAFEDPKTHKVTDASGKDITALILPPETSADVEKPTRVEGLLNGRPSFAFQKGTRFVDSDGNDVTKGFRPLQTSQERDAANNAPSDVQIKPGSKEDHIADDLAFGGLTFAQFRGLYPTRSNKGSDLKAAIYDRARQKNPDFNPAQFEAGYSYFKSPKTRQQLGSIANVEAGVPDLLKFSNEAARSGVTALNGMVNKGGYMIGGKQYSNFRTAVTAFADELSGALGYGSATDMSREMGFSMTDPNLSPEAFASAVQDVIIPFIERKKKSIVDQEGVYGKPQGGAGKITVVDPAGKSHPFDTQAQADAFKKLAGIK